MENNKVNPTILLIASNNPGKIAEIQRILSDQNTWQVDMASHWYRLNRQKQLNFPEETGSSFAENARIKSEAIAVQTGQWCLADDSGLVVPALDNQPGVYSARYGGLDSDLERNQFLLQNMQTITDRKAYFMACLSLASPIEGEIKRFIGECHGRIMKTIVGNNGFGYDPVFQPNGYSKSMAELTSEQKDAISHRGQSLRQFAEFSLSFNTNIVDTQQTT